MSEIQYITWDELLHVYEKTVDEAVVFLASEIVSVWNRCLNLYRTTCTTLHLKIN